MLRFLAVLGCAVWAKSVKKLAFDFDYVVCLALGPCYTPIKKFVLRGRGRDRKSVV